VVVMGGSRWFLVGGSDVTCIIIKGSRQVGYPFRLTNGSFVLRLKADRKGES